MKCATCCTGKDLSRRRKFQEGKILARGLEVGGSLARVNRGEIMKNPYLIVSLGNGGRQVDTEGQFMHGINVCRVSGLSLMFWHFYLPLAHLSYP